MNTILGRDLAEHGWVLLPALLAAGAVLVVATLLGMFPQLSGTAPEALLTYLPVHRDPLAALRAFVVIGLTPLAFLLVDRLISVEYRRRGWDLLERLPITRARVLYGKVTLTVALLGALLACGWLVVLSASVTFQRSIPDDRAAAALWDASGYLAVVTGYLLLTATLGRRRLLPHVVVAGGVLIATRHGLPLRAVPGLDYLSGGAGGGPTGLALGFSFTFLAFVCVCAWSGRLTRACQGPITRADVGLPAALAVSLLLLANPRGEPAPYELRGDVARVGAVTVRVLTPADAARSEQLARTLAQDAARLERFGLRPPQVVIEHAPALDGSTWERARLRRAGGLLLRLNVLRADARDPDLRAWVLGQAFDHATGARFRHGGWRLLLDGIGRARADDVDHTVLAAWASTRVDLRPTPHFLAWEGVTQRCGADASRALAGWVLKQMAQLHGTDTITRLFVQAIESRRAAGSSVGARAARFRAVYADATGGSLELLADRLRAEVSGLQRAARPGLDRLPPVPAATLQIEQGRLTVDGDRTPAVGLLHGRLPDRRHAESRPTRWERDEAAAAVRLVSTRRYPSGARVRAALVARVDWLRADLVFGWQELTIP